MKRTLVMTLVVVLGLMAGASYASVGWANYQWPCSGASYADNANIDIYSQAWKGGCTDQPAPCADLQVSLFYRKATDPTYTEVPMHFNVKNGNNDEYTAQIPAEATTAGVQEQYYIRYFDTSDQSPYDPQDHCDYGGGFSPMALNITPATAQDVTVTFRVDMSCLGADLYANGVYGAGDFTGWNGCGPALVLTDPDGDKIYTGTYLFAAGSNPYHEFKFNRNGSDGCQWEGNVANRIFIIDDTQPTNALPVYKWDGWDCCVPTGPASISGAGSYCLTLCAGGPCLDIPLITSYNPPIIAIMSFMPGCQSCGGGGGGGCTAGVGSPTGDIVQVGTSWVLRVCLNGTEAVGGCFCLTTDNILPVELSSFDAVPGDNSVSLKWTTASETHNDYFEIVRDGVALTRVTSSHNATGSTYAWTDHSATNGVNYAYTLFAVSDNGTRDELRTIHATPALTAGVAADYALMQNFPNPFNPSTTIAFDLANDGFASLKVYNLAGQEVMTLVNGTMSSGCHILSFHADNLPSGIYLYRLSTNGFVAEKKMLLIK